MKRAVSGGLMGIALVIWPAMTFAQTDPVELSRIAVGRLDAAQAALAAADGARDRVDALTRTVRAYEEGLEALREGLRQAALRERAILSEFEATREELSRLLGVLIGIQGAQGPLGLIHPSGALGTARSGMIVTEITPALQARADHLRARLEELNASRTLQETALERLRTGLTGAQDARARLSQAIAAREDLPARFADDAAAMDLLAANVASLADFATGLANLGPALEPGDAILPFRSARGRLPLPVHGKLLRGFDEADAAGIRRPGLVVAARPLSLVTAPWPATIRYAGPLLDYGQVVVLEPEAQILLIVAGMSRLYADDGQVVQAGAPLGQMGGAEPDPNTILLNAVNGTGSGHSETLYIELRESTVPIDPTDWFAETKEKLE